MAKSKAEKAEGIPFELGLTPGADPSTKDRSLIARWTHPEILGKGFVPVAINFIELYSKLNPPLSTGEAMFVIHLLRYKWSEEHPYPGYETLAKQMGVGDKAVRRHAATLEGKRYLKRKLRVGTTNRFDLTPLFDKLKAASIKESKKKSKKEDWN